MRQRYAIEDAEHPIYQRKPTMTAKHVPATPITDAAVFPSAAMSAADRWAHLVAVTRRMEIALRECGATIDVIEKVWGPATGYTGRARALLRELGEAE